MSYAPSRAGEYSRQAAGYTARSNAAGAAIYRTTSAVTAGATLIGATAATGAAGATAIGIATSGAVAIIGAAGIVAALRYVGAVKGIWPKT